jgi:hypothetical protein
MRKSKRLIFVTAALNSPGRWMEEDPEHYINGANMFDFEENNPVDGLDPTGTKLTLLGQPGDVKKVRDILDNLEKNGSDAIKTKLDYIENGCDTDVRITVVSGDKDVVIGNYPIHQIDIGDIELAPKTGPFSQQSLLVHEIVEQAEKQILKKGLSDADVSFCHDAGKQAEDDVTGWTRGKRDFTSRKPDGSFRTTIIYTNDKDGSTVKVVMIGDKDGKLTITVGQPAASQPSAPQPAAPPK